MSTRTAHDHATDPFSSDLTRKLVLEAELLTATPTPLNARTEQETLDRLIVEYDHLDPEMRKELAALADLLADKEGQLLRAAIRHDGEAEVIVSEDAMKVTLSLTAADGGGKFITTGDVIARLKAMGVVQGVDMEAISVLVTEVLKTGKGNGPRQIAAGRASTLGKDGAVVPLPGEMIPGTSGRRKQEWMTQQGSVLAKLVAPTAGVPGVNVFGQELPCSSGRAASLPIQPGVVFNSLDGTYVAAFDGLAVFDGQTLEVRRHLVWMGDLTLNDKAIEFDGTVVIRGTVRDGAKVVATEDIDVQAGIEAATVVSTGGAVRVKQGVAGRGCGFVSAKTVVDVRYLEHATVYCEGDIVVRHAVIHSRLTAGKKVNVESSKGGRLWGRRSRGDFDNGQVPRQCCGYFNQSLRGSQLGRPAAASGT